MESTASQCDLILAWLRAGNTLTGLEAITRFKCIRLASRITDLKSRGVEVYKERVKLPLSGKHVIRYSLPGPADAAGNGQSIIENCPGSPA
jgi:hypothetical protein